MYTRRDLVNTAGLDEFLIEIIVRNGLLAVVIYTNLNILIPVFIKRQRVFAYFSILTLCLLGYALLKNAHDAVSVSLLNPSRQDYFFQNTFYNVSIAFFYVAFSVALELSREWYLQRETIRQIEVEKLQTELSYLKAQINPHFLFNSINTIYFQIEKENSVARQMLSSFSDMLRYQLYECNVGEIAVEKEVKYLSDYVDLQKMRKDENYSIEFHASRDLHGFAIAPLLLIPFVENAFKHVSHFPSGNKIAVTMGKKPGCFFLHVFNTRDFPTTEKISQGIGLRNVARRLELIYNGKHTLEITDRPDSFKVELTLQIAVIDEK
jgi:LytS/YehU family sensor histidine kinase